MKTCSKCNIEKHEMEFRIRRDRPCGLVPRCKACDKIYNDHYFKTPNGKLAVKRYWQSDKGRLADQRNTRTPKGLIRTRHKTRRRRERKLALDLVLSKEDIKAIYERFGNQCFNCNAADRLEIDHHYPLSKGFGLSAQNAVVLCKSCNVRKHDSLPVDFYTENKLKELSVLLIGSIQPQ